MLKPRHTLSWLLVPSLLLLAACGGDEEPAAAAAPTEAPEAVEAPAETAPAPETPGTVAHVFAQGTELVSADEGAPIRNPILAVTKDGVSWGALVRSGAGLTWVVDGETTPIAVGEVSEFTVSGDLSRYAYVTDGVVVVDGKQVEQGTTSCCPTFSRDGSRFGYIAGGSVAVIDGVPQESHGVTAEQLVLSLVGRGVAYIADGNTAVLDGEAQETYDSVSALTFSQDGSHFAYVADDSILVVDGKEREIGESVAEQIAFSPDGSRLAYVKGSLNSGKAYLEEKEQKRHSFGCAQVMLKWGCIAVVSDGSSLAYTTPVLTLGGVAGSQRLDFRVVRDGDRDTFFLVCCLIASPEGSHVAYVSARRGLVIDGQPVETVATALTSAPLAVSYGDRLEDPASVVAADVVFSADGKGLAFLLYETDQGTRNPLSITRLHLESLEVP